MGRFRSLSIIIFQSIISLFRHRHNLMLLPYNRERHQLMIPRPGMDSDQIMGIPLTHTILVIFSNSRVKVRRIWKKINLMFDYYVVFWVWF